MQVQTTTLADFRRCIEEGKSIVGCADGNWYCRWNITQVIRRLLGWQEYDDIGTALFFRRYLRNREITSATFKDRFDEDGLDEIQRTSQAIVTRLRTYIDREKARKQELEQQEAPIKAELAKISTFKGMEEDAKKKLKNPLKEQLRNLKEELGVLKCSTLEKEFEQHVVALKYRATAQNEIHRTKFQRADKQWLTEELRAWKQFQFPPIPEEVSNTENDAITRTCQYPEVVQMLRADPDYKDWYFRFVFRNSSTIQNAVDIAVQFPTITKRLVVTFLDKRVKRLKNDGIHFTESKDRQKDVQLLIEGKYHSLRSDTQRVIFNDATGMSMGAIMRELKERNYVLGSLEYLQNGLVRCHPKYPQCNFENPEWWKELPAFEILTKAEIESRYDIQLDQKGLHGVMIVRASAEKDGLKVLDNHSWILVAAPIAQNRFAMIPVGKYAQEFILHIIPTLKAYLPKAIARLAIPVVELLLKLFFIFRTKKAIVTCFDENEFYYHRRHFFLPKPLTKDQFDRLMDKIKNDLQLARDGNLIFQAQGDNCSTLTQETYDTIFPGEKRLFDIEMSQTEVPPPLNHVLHGITKLENVSHSLAIAARVACATILFFLGWAGSIVNVNGRYSFRNLVFYENFREGIVQLPAALPRNRREDISVGSPEGILA